MAPLRAGLALNLDHSLLQAALPLLQSGQVGTVEWAFDTLSGQNPLPDWFEALLDSYAEADGLLGHGVFFSLFGGQWTTYQAAWLRELARLSARYRLSHVTEHFGFMTGADFHAGAPLSIPLTTTTLALGQDRLKRIQQACGCPVGLENLAFALTLDDVKRQGEFLDRLLDPINGCLILDLHNLYCQCENFGLTYQQLLAMYPLDRVRELHLSGGSWVMSSHEPGRNIRRDTHDEAVPDAVFGGLELALAQCRNLRFVLLEQLGNSLTTNQERTQYQTDFYRMNTLVTQHAQPPHPMNSFTPNLPLNLGTLPLENQLLHRQQLDLSAILETSTDTRQAQQLLVDSSLAHTDWNVENWQPSMLETAIAIARKWQKKQE